MLLSECTRPVRLIQLQLMEGGTPEQRIGGGDADNYSLGAQALQVRRLVELKRQSAIPVRR